MAVDNSVPLRSLHRTTHGVELRAGIRTGGDMQSQRNLDIICNRNLASRFNNAVMQMLGKPNAALSCSSHVLPVVRPTCTVIVTIDAATNATSQDQGKHGRRNTDDLASLQQEQ